VGGEIAQELHEKKTKQDPLAFHDAQ